MHLSHDNASLTVLVAGFVACAGTIAVAGTLLTRRADVSAGVAILLG